MRKLGFYSVEIWRLQMAGNKKSSKGINIFITILVIATLIVCALMASKKFLLKINTNTKSLEES